MKYTVLLAVLGLTSCAGYKPTSEDILRAVEGAGYVIGRVVETSGK